jgi:hypothetical protein
VSAYTGRYATRIRRYWAQRLITCGPLVCWRCGDWIRACDPGTSWDVGHLVDLAAGGAPGLEHTAPEHARCNRSAGGRAGARARTATARRVRAWP